MRKYNLLRDATVAFALIALIANIAAAQYWFQSGVRGSNDAAFNNGASVSIQTIYQNATNGSLGFWVGEDLSNGAFIQAGYEITNTSGYYSTSCGSNTKSVFIQAGVPTWFWEYFSSAYNSSSFCGGIGPNGSAGKNGTFNTYSFKSLGNIWTAYFNGDQIGSINLGASTSGPNPPSAFAEYAETNTNTWPIKTVQFKNLLYYIGNATRQVAQGYSSIGYGKGSESSLPNDYGVQEVGSYVNFFEVGSNISTSSKDTELWKIGYSLTVQSQYGNLTGSGNYIDYAVVNITAPKTVNITNGVREEFNGWVGTGAGSYSGNDTQAAITIYQNTTETAMWKKQYYLNVSSSYGNVKSGWYNANTSVTLQVSNSLISTGTGSRVVFAGWSNGDTTNKTTAYMDAPQSFTLFWTPQYYLTTFSPYGNTTGSGWYDSGSTANVSVNATVIPINQSTRYAFYNWSDGQSGNSIGVVVDHPTMLSAIFKKQYLVTLNAQNSYGDNITNIDYYNVSGTRVNSSGQIFVFGNKTYNIQYIYYKGVPITTNYKFSAPGPEALSFKTPIYNIVINTESVFGTPINATLNITFKNSTQIKTYSGNSGSQSFNNVPYGYVAGYAEYFGIKEGVNAINGFSPYLTFLTAGLFVFIIGGILFIVAVALITTRYDKRRRSSSAAK